jgi:hypothetical protein
LRVQVYALGSGGDFYSSDDGGRSWDPRTLPLAGAGSRRAEPEQFRGHCAVDTDGAVLIQAWFFEPEGAVLAHSTDGGKAWTTLVAPYERNLADGIGFVDGGIFYASEDQRVYTVRDPGAGEALDWRVSQPAPVSNQGAKNPSVVRSFASDGEQVVMGAVAGSHSLDEEPLLGNIFLSRDGGLSFGLIPLPWQPDPTLKVEASLRSLQVLYAPSRQGG